MKILSRLFFFLCLPGIIWHAPLRCEPITKTIDLVEDYSNFSPWDLLLPFLSIKHLRFV